MPKTASKKVVHEVAEATGEFLGNKIADKILNPKYVIDEKSKKSWRNNYTAKKINKREKKY